VKTMKKLLIDAARRQGAQPIIREQQHVAKSLTGKWCAVASTDSANANA
jgi:hypothetical protein